VTIRRIFSLVLLLVSPLVFLGCAAVLHAQNAKKDSNLRTVRGVLLDKSDAPVQAGVVFLKNNRTTTIRSYISDAAGNYRFSGLDPNADYEVHAEKDDTKSQAHTISSFDSRTDIVINLKLDKKKS
jgi:Carboxypeptidase regulatory-like domain